MSIRNFLGLILYYGISRHLPKSRTPIVGQLAKSIRRANARLIFKHVGKEVNIEPKAHFGKGLEIRIEECSGIGINSRLPDNIQIGKYVMMAEDVMILGQNHSFNDISTPMCFQGFGSKTQLVIEDDVWIGTRVIILPSVTLIGKGSILGAGTIVTKNVPPYAVVVGNPGKILKYRNISRQ